MPTYKVIYFNMTGRAEPIRLVFSYGNIPFIDERIQKDDWAKLKPSTPFGQLPVLEIDGESFGQSSALVKYAASVVGLDGKDAIENLRINTVVEALSDLQKALGDLRMTKDEAKKPELKKTLQEKIAHTFTILDKNAKKNGGYLALNRISWVDVTFLHYYEGLVNVLDENVLSPYPSLQAVKKNVLSQEGIKKWIKNRPENPMKPKYDLKQDV